MASIYDLKIALQNEITSLVLQFNRYERNWPEALQGLDVEANLNQMLEALSRTRTLALSAGQEKDLRQSIRDYFATERLIHRITRQYLKGRLAFLFTHSQGLLLPPRLISPLIQQYSPVLEEGGCVAVGVGCYGNEIDLRLGASRMVSTSLELGDRLQGEYAVTDAAIAVILHAEAKHITPLVAVDVPDIIHLDSSWLTPMDPQEIMRSILDLPTLGRLREQAIVCQGLQEKDLPLHFPPLEHYTPLKDREVLIPGGVGPRFLEYIVVADDLYEQARDRVAGMPLAEKVLAASQYYAKDSQGEYVNERLRRGNRARQHILDILHG